MPEQHLPNEIRKGNKNEPVGIKLVLGWVLLDANDKEKYSLNSNRIWICESNIHDMLKQFWQIESYGTSKENPETLLPKSEQKAIEILNKTVCEEKSGHYSVGLLWKNKNTKLPYNREIAVSRLKSLENKFKKEPEFCKKYQQIIESYLKNGYATKLNTKLYNENNLLVNYIPHHGVKNVNKPGKIRVVFDAGAKCNNTSLNENLLKEPIYLSKLINILIKFRKEKFAVTGDIKEMYHQIFVSPKNQDALRFVWRKFSTDPIEDYRMNVHIFGKIDSSCIANWVVKKNS